MRRAAHTCARVCACVCVCVRGWVHDVMVASACICVWLRVGVCACVHLHGVACSASRTSDHFLTHFLAVVYISDATVLECGDSVVCVCVCVCVCACVCVCVHTPKSYFAPMLYRYSIVSFIFASSRASSPLPSRSLDCPADVS